MSNAWPFEAFGNSNKEERGKFYDAMPDGEAPDNANPWALIMGNAPRLIENPNVEIGLLLEDGSFDIPNKIGHRPSLHGQPLNVFLEKYFVAAMPGHRFHIQIVARAEHHFRDRQRSHVAHSLAAQGVVGSYANFWAEPVFSGLSTGDALTLDLAINFLGDQATDDVLEFLNSSAVGQGLKLANAFNPAYGMITSWVTGLSKSLLLHRKNRTITSTRLTLSHASRPLSLPLKDGTYLLVQPAKGEANIPFQRYRLDGARAVVNEDGKPLNRNHLLFAIQPVSVG